MKCGNCGFEMEIPEPEELQIARLEDRWMNHCEEMLKNRGRPRSFENLPQNIKTLRMQQYYLKKGLLKTKSQFHKLTDIKDI